MDTPRSPSCRSAASRVWRSSATFAYRLGVRCCCSPPSPRAALRYVLGLPEVVDFLHYPVVLLFALAAADRPPRAASRAPGRWLVIFFLVVLLSAVAHPDVPTRAVLFLLIAGEPLVVIWAIARWGVDESAVRTVGVVAVLLAAIQIPIGVYQGLVVWMVGPGSGHVGGTRRGTSRPRGALRPRAVHRHRCRPRSATQSPHGSGGCRPLPRHDARHWFDGGLGDRVVRSNPRAADRAVRAAPRDEIRPKGRHRRCLLVS